MSCRRSGLTIRMTSRFGRFPFIAIVLALPVILFTDSVSSAQDFFGCEMALQSLASSAQSAAMDASTAESECSDAEDTCDHARRCRSHPDTFDLYGDRCETYALRCRSAQGSCESSRSSLEMNLLSLESSVSSVELSCGYSFSRDPEEVQKKLHGLLKRYGAPHE